MKNNKAESEWLGSKNVKIAKTLNKVVRVGFHELLYQQALAEAGPDAHVYLRSALDSGEWSGDAKTSALQQQQGITGAEQKCATEQILPK